MEAADPDITVRSSIESMQKDQWGQLTNPDFPFSDHSFLAALEQSGCIGADCGWAPSYITLSHAGRLAGASFLYTKTDSYGEYIFDWSWAKAYQQYGEPYYPKLVSAVPFTPATGPKLLIQSGQDKHATAEILIKTAIEQMKLKHCNSLHYLFITDEEIPYFEKQGFLIRHSFQYHWENRKYGSFDDFLAALKPKRRKQIVRERSQLTSEGLQLRIITGDELQEEHAEIFFAFYLNTIRKMQAIPYLNADFFKIMFQTMCNNVVLMLAEEAGQAVAGALYLTKGKHLYGRYWGAIKEIKNLHFELCYYLPIEWSIKRGIERFEAGAQGEHKIARGFLPQKTFSAHLIRHPGFLPAIGRFIEEEQKSIQEYFDDLDKHSPYLR